MTKSIIGITSILMGLMALTRFHHFGSAFSLPDASLAVFFMAGFCNLKARIFWVLVALAGSIDYFAIAQFKVSDYCISPAYIWLLPTYAVMWMGGRLASAFSQLNFAASFKILGIAIVAVTLAFALSNGSFYWFSGKFADLSWPQYLEKTGHYYLPYASSTLFYCLLSLAVFKFVKIAQPHLLPSRSH